MGLLGTSHMDWAGTYVNNRRPVVSAGEAFRQGVSQGARHEWLWETMLDYRDRSARMNELEEQDPRNSEVLQPSQIAEEFPGIRKPLLNPSPRSYAKYIQERDLLENKIAQAFMGRDGGSALQMLSSFSGSLAGGIFAGAFNPINYALLAIPYGVGFGLFATKKAVMAARLAQKTVMSRGVLGAATAVDTMAADALYIAGHKLTREYFLDKHYGWDEAAIELGIGGVLGGGLGFALPTKFHPRFTEKDENLLQVMAAVTAEYGDMPYQQALKFIKNEEGFVGLPTAAEPLKNIAKAVRGQSSPPRTILGPKKLEGLEKTARTKSHLQTFDQALKDRAKSSKGFGNGFRVTSQGITAFGGVKFRTPKPFFSGYSGQTVPMEAVFKGQGGTARVNTLYTWIPQGSKQKVDRVTLYASPEEAAVAGFLRTKERTQHITQVDSSGMTFLDAETPFDMTLQSALPTRVASRTYMDVPMGLMNQTDNALERSGKYDGVWVPGEGGSHKVKVFRKKMRGIKSFSDQFGTYELPDKKIDSNDVQEMVKILEGKTPDSRPAAINNIVQHYFEGMDRKKDTTENIFEKYIKRDHPEILYKVGTPTFLESVPFMHKGKTYNIPYFKDPTLWKGVPFSGKNVLRSVATKYIKRKGHTDSFFRGKETIHDMAQKVGKEDGLEGVTDLRDLFKGEGVTFLDAIDIDSHSTIYMMLGTKVLPPTKGKATVKSSILAGDEDYLDLPLLWDRRKEEPGKRVLNLTKYPSYMTMEEAMLGKYFTRRDKRPSMSSFGNSTEYLSDVSGKVLTPRVQKLLKDLGYDKVVYRVSGKNLEKELSGTRSLPKNGTQLTRVWGELKDELDKKEELPEGATRQPDELVGYFDSVYDTVLNSQEVDFYSTLAADTKASLPADTPAYDSIDFLIRGRTEARRDMEAAELGSVAYLNAFRKAKEFEHDIDHAFRIVKFINSGGLKQGNLGGVSTPQVLKYNFLYEGGELLNLFKSQHNMPYQVLGGLNIETTQKSFYNGIVTPTLARLREVGGDQLIEDLFKGKLDKEILMIQYARRQMKKEQSGVAGQVGEKLAELPVSQEALKAEGILKEGMALSQKYLTESGYHRESLPDYIGRRSYNTNKILKTSREEFINDVLQYGENIGPAEASNLRDSFALSDSVAYQMRDSISNVQERFNKQRRLRFKDADSEFAFMQKYGSASSVVGVRLPLISTSHSFSNLMNGFMSSAQSDSSLGAVTSVFGPRPFLSLEVAHSLLDKKRIEANRRGDLSDADSLKLSRKIDRTKALSSVMLRDWISYDASRWGTGFLSTSTRTLKSLTNMSILSSSSVYAVLGDRLTSAAHLEKIVRGKDEKRGPKSLFKSYYNSFSKLLSPLNAQERQKVASLMNVVLTADTKDYLSRHTGEAAGEVSWLESLAMRTFLTPQITDRNKAGQMFAVGHAMLDKFKRPWTALHPETQNLFSQYQITPEVWEMVRVLPDVTANSMGHDFLSLQDLRLSLVTRFGEVQGRKVYRMFESFFQDTLSKSVVESSVYSRAFWRDGTEGSKESPIYNLHRLAEMLKATQFEAYLSARSYLHELKGKGERPFFWDAQGIAPVLAMMVASGAMTVWLHDVINGKTPRLPETKGATLDLFAEAMLRSGGFGLYGDFILGSNTGSLWNWLGFFTGPAIQGAYQIGRLPISVSHSVGGESFEPLGKNFLSIWDKFAPSVSPVIKIMLNTFFLDTLGDLSRWRYYDEKIGARRRRAEELGQTYFGEL